ncbi:MAG: DUF2085 domain-containing protein [Chloroflexales bacterium]|nr:DUF2085 domain-containing protein [Chloroflexales bacterium]
MTTSLRSWYWLVIGMYSGVVAGILFWPSLPLPSWPSSHIAWNMYASVHGVCAQVHNTALAGQQLPLCARNTGIYGAMTLSMLAMVLAGRLRYTQYGSKIYTVLLLFPIVFVGIDGFNSLSVDLGMTPLYQPQNWLRAMTGSFAGIAIAPIFIPTLNRVLRNNGDDHPMIAKWWQLVGLWALALGYAALISIGPGWLYWPIAVVSWGGIVGILLISNTFAVAVAAGYDQRKISHLTELVKPFLVATLITSVELGIMAWLRFGFEASGFAR